MMTLLEDLRLLLLQICRAVGLSGTTATVVPLVLLGVALNLGALSAVESIRGVQRLDHQQTPLRSVALTEIKVVRTVVGSALKSIGNGERRWCPAQERMIDRRTGFAFGNLDFGLTLAAPGQSKDCSLEIASSPHRMAIAFVQC